MHVSLSWSQVDLISCVFAFWHCASVYVRLSAFLRGDESSTCVWLRLREQCLRSEITLVSRVVHVLLLRLVAGNMDVNTLTAKRSELIGKRSDCSKAPRNPQKSTCVCLVLQLPRFRRDARFDLWPALLWSSDTQLKSILVKYWLYDST